MAATENYPEKLGLGEYHLRNTLHECHCASIKNSEDTNFLQEDSEVEYSIVLLFWA